MLAPHAALRRAMVPMLALAHLGCAHAVAAPPVARPVRVETTSAPPVTPPIEGELARRTALVERAFRARGAAVIAERWSAFAREGALSGFSLAIDRPQCVGLVGVSPDGVRDLDLFALDASGSELARDDRGNAHPYLRVCLRAPGSLRVLARATQGNGQVAVLVVSSPPIVAPPLEDVLGTHPAGLASGPRTPRGMIGRDPARPAPAELARRLASTYVTRGWRALGGAVDGSLAQQEVATREVSLEAGGCYLVQGVGGDGVDDLDLAVHAPDGELIAQDLALDALPVVRFCAERSGAHQVEVRMYAGAGAWSLLTLAMPTPRNPSAPRDLDPVARARWSELALEAEARGMTPAAPAIRGAPWGSLSQAIPVQLVAGRCYLAGVAADANAVAVDLWLADPNGAVLASDTGERERATIYHCATRSAQASLNVRTPNGRGTWVLQSFEGGGPS